MRPLPVLTVILATFLAVQVQAAEQPAEPEPKAKRSKPELLFTQSAEDITFDGKVLTLSGIGPGTFYFSDRPFRLTGFLTHKDFVDYWNGSGDTFRQDPPNAALILVAALKKEPLVFELNDATLGEGTLSYEVTLLAGEAADVKGAGSLFIDFGGGHGGGGGRVGGGGGHFGGGGQGFHGGPGGFGGGGGNEGGGFDRGGENQSREEFEEAAQGSRGDFDRPYNQRPFHDGFFDDGPYNQCSFFNLFENTSLCF